MKRMIAKDPTGAGSAGTVLKTASLMAWSAGAVPPVLGVIGLLAGAALYFAGLRAIHRVT